MLKLILKSNQPVLLNKKDLLFHTTQINQLKFSTIEELNCLKLQKKIYTILKSPHVHKKSREQFALKKFKKSFIVTNPNVISLLYFLIIFKKSIYTSNLFISKIII